MKFSNLFELVEKIKTESQAIRYFTKIRWNGKITCPHCGHHEVYTLKGKTKAYKCKSNKCNKLFSYKTGTIFENSKISMKKWFLAIYLHGSHKKGISSYQLSRDLKITQKTAWFMLSRIREIMNELQDMLKGTVEIDECYIGGKAENKHMKDRIKSKGVYKKTIVFGMLERDGKLKAMKIDDTKANTLQSHIYNNIEEKAIIVTDEHKGYHSIGMEYNHKTINHSMNEYVKEYTMESRTERVKAFKIHTNSIEGFWSHMKRGINGIYHWISINHAQRYINEFQYRWNSRKMEEGDRFENLLFASVGKRLRYGELIKQ